MPDRRAAMSIRSRIKRSLPYGLAPLARAGLRPHERFVVFCPPRTGSTLLTTLLDSHPDIRCEGELLANGAPRPLALFDGRAARARLNGSSAWGCKIITLHTRWFADAYGAPRELLERLIDQRYHLIVLRRRDWLLQALSVVHAQANRYHYTKDDGAVFERMHVDPVEVLADLHVIEQEARLLDEAVDGLPHLSLWYEDDLYGPEAQQRTTDLIAGRLGLPPAAARTRQVAIAPPSLEGRVANLGELAGLLGATRFARFLPGGDHARARPARYGEVGVTSLGSSEVGSGAPTSGAATAGA